MLSDKRRYIASVVGAEFGYSHFVMMLNPKYRGPKFTWESLANTAANLAEGQIGLEGNWGRDLKAMRKVAAESARATISFCLRESNIQQWLPLENEEDERNS